MYKSQEINSPLYTSQQNGDLGWGLFGKTDKYRYL